MNILRIFGPKNFITLKKQKDKNLPSGMTVDEYIRKVHAINTQKTIDAEIIRDKLSMGDACKTLESYMYCVRSYKDCSHMCQVCPYYVDDAQIIEALELSLGALEVIKDWQDSDTCREADRRN